MNPYLIGGLALVAFFLLRRSPQAVPAGGAAGGTAGGDEAPGPTMTANPVVNGNTIALPTEADAASVERAIARLRELDEQRRREVTEAMEGQRTSLVETTIRAAARAPVYGAGRSLTDFGA